MDPIAPESVNWSPDIELINTASPAASRAICCCIPVKSTILIEVSDVELTVSLTLATMVPDPITPATEVPAAIFGLPEIGEPTVGEVPLKAMEKLPEGVSNLDVMLLTVPLLNTENVGVPIDAPV